MAGKRRFAFLGICVCAALGASAVAACSDDNKATSTASPEAGTGDTGTGSDEKIKFGVSLGLSNGLKSFSEVQQKALLLAEAQINAKGGVLGKQIQLIIEDDQSEKGTALAAAMDKFLNKEKVSAIIGPLGSGQVAASHEVVKAAKVIQLSPSATSDTLSNVGGSNPLFGGTDRYFFRTVVRDEFQGKGVARFAYDGPKDAVAAGDGGVSGCRRLAIVHIDDAYGTTLVPIIKAAFEKRGGAVVMTESIPTDVTAFTNAAAVVSKLVAIDPKPECQAIIMYDDVAGKYMKAFDAANAKNSLPSKFFSVGTDGIYTGGFKMESRTKDADPASRNVSAGVYGTNPDTNPQDRPEFQDFKSLFTAKYPLAAGETDVGAFSANAFDCAILAALAVQKAGTSTDGAKIRDALVAVSKGSAAGATKYGPNTLAGALAAAKRGEDINYEGASGNVDLKDDGSVNSGLIIWKLEQVDGKEPEYSTKETIRFEDL